MPLTPPETPLSYLQPMTHAAECGAQCVTQIHMHCSCSPCHFKHDGPVQRDWIHQCWPNTHPNMRPPLAATSAVMMTYHVILLSWSSVRWLGSTAAGPPPPMVASCPPPRTTPGQDYAMNSIA
jgi:hypothetical protein